MMFSKKPKKANTITTYYREEYPVYFLGDPKPYYISQLMAEARSKPEQLTLFDYDSLYEDNSYDYNW